MRDRGFHPFRDELLQHWLIFLAHRLHRHTHRTHLVERFFARLKQFRRVATRYDKLAERFASFISLAAAYIWLV